MPIYEYRCGSCAERFEILVSTAERDARRCPRCGAADIQRLLSTFAVGRPSATTPAPGPCGSTDCACRAHDA